jgi:hypothetical protein
MSWIWFRKTRSVVAVLIAGAVCVVGLSIALSLYLGHAGLGQGSSLIEAELAAAKRQSEVCSDRNAAGVGLRGEYFPAPGFKGKPLVTRVDAAVNFSKDLEWPSSLKNAKPQSVRWSGWVRPAMTGLYSFHVSAPGARITISRQAIQSGTAVASQQIALAAGRYYPVVIEVPALDAPGFDGAIQFEWTAPHGMRFLVPRALLYLPTDQTSAVAV